MTFRPASSDPPADLSQSQKNRFAVVGVWRSMLALLLIVLAGQAHAHASEQGFVLLLPTDFYVAAGVAAVVLTLMLIVAMPPHAAKRIFRPASFGKSRRAKGAVLTSCLAFLIMLAVLAIGLVGPHDPTRNALPLGFWTLFWVVFVILQGLFGNLWKWLNPWSGPYTVVRLFRFGQLARLPTGLGYWPALASFLGFSAVLLAHPAPSDPDTLALMIASYWVFHFAGMIIFGPKWLRRAEGLSVLLTNYASIATLGSCGGRFRIGLTGWKTLTRPAPAISLAIFMIATLAIGSFDGLNETFWWFAQIGINPLEFPGRTAVVGENLIGLALVVPMLVIIYGLAVWLGLRIIGQHRQFQSAFCTFTPAILPIALAYHFAHYLPSFLVEIQFVARMFAGMFDLPPVQVTTGFFNTIATVRVIWLSQAVAVVAGHVVAILLSHVLALKLFGSHRKAAVSQIPLAIFMVAYTFFGLWLLASPRGV